MKKYDSQAHREACELMEAFTIYRINQMIDPICKTRQQRIFYYAYAVTVSSTGGTNAAECARLAGYSPRSAKVAAARLLADGHTRFIADEAKWWYRHRFEWLKHDENFDEWIEFRTREYAHFFISDEARVEFFNMP